MRVVMITDPFLPKIDGIVTMLVNTVECLRRRGDEVLIFAPKGGPEELFGAQVVGLPSVPFPLYKELRLAAPRARMRQMIRDFQPDVIHVFEPALLGLAGLYYSESLRLPLVVSSHTNIPAYVHYYKLRLLEDFTWTLMRLRHRRANLTLCTSSVTMNDLLSHRIDDVALWERAVDAERFSPDAYSTYMRCTLSENEPHKPLLLYVGRLSAEKDVACLRDVLQAMPDVRLAIVGDGPVRGDLERHFRGTPTVFMGYMHGSELASAFASSDLFVLPSQTETLGLVLLEAMAAGCPVVACRAGGVPDAVQDGVTGYLFEPDDADALVNTVRRALGNTSELAAVKLRARQDVEQYSWQAATDKLRVLYQQTIDGYAPKIPAKGVVQRVAGAAILKTFRALLP